MYRRFAWPTIDAHRNAFKKALFFIAITFTIATSLARSTIKCWLICLVKCSTCAKRLLLCLSFRCSMWQFHQLGLRSSSIYFILWFICLFVCVQQKICSTRIVMESNVLQPRLVLEEALASWTTTARTIALRRKVRIVDSYAKWARTIRFRSPVDVRKVNRSAPTIARGRGNTVQLSKQ